MPGMLRPEPISDDESSYNGEYDDVTFCIEILDHDCDVCGEALRCTTKDFHDGRPLDDRIDIECVVCDGSRRFAARWICAHPESLEDHSFMETMEFWLGPRREWLGPLMN